MKYYAQISGIFCLLTMGVTFWMSHELGLLSYGSLEAANEKKTTETKATESKEAEVKKTEGEKLEVKPTDSTAAKTVEKVEDKTVTGSNDKTPPTLSAVTSNKKEEAEQVHKIEVASNSVDKNDALAKIDASAAKSEVGTLKGDTSGPIDEREVALETREKLLKDKEQILREQADHYEKVLGELRQKLGSQSKENKSISSQKDIECSTKLKQQEGDYKLQLSKKESEWKEKSNRKASELQAALAKRDAELKNTQLELKNLKDSRADAFRAMYEKMEPKKAAKIMNEMDLDLAHKILSSIKQDRAAEILALMTTVKAKHITEKAYPNRATASSENK